MKKTLMISLAAAAVLSAADAAKDPNAFMTHTELSYVTTEGNTNTDAFSFDFAGKKAWGLHSVRLDVDALYGTEDNIENKNKLVTELNYDWQFEKRLAFNYVVGYKDDKFSGYDYQFYTGPGFKYHAIVSDAHNMNVLGNILYSVDRTMDKYYDPVTGDEIKYPYPDGKAGATKVDGSEEDYTGYLLRMDYVWQIAEGFKFIQDASYRSDFEDADNYFVHSKTAVESKINGNFSMGVSYKIDYANLPPAGNERTDKTFMTSLIIDY